MIPDIKELNFPKIDGKQYATLTQATVNIADMGEKTITAQVRIDGSITPDFSRDWAVAFQGEKYIMPLRIPQGSKGNESLDSVIDLTFQHWAIYQLKRWIFFTVQPVESGTATPDKYIADVQLNLGDLCGLLGQVLAYYYGDTITIDLNPDLDYKKEGVPISISYSYIWDVLIKLYELFGVRWQIGPGAGNVNGAGGGERYVIKVGYPSGDVGQILEYGFEGGLLKVERQVQSEEIRNMLLGRGGETNMPRYYFKKSQDEKKWHSDPDWIEELANIYFDRLRGATFRSYIQGWKAAHISKYSGYTAVGEENAYAPWAYYKGYTDAKFDPVEYVRDDDSIAKYGPLLGGLDNNDDIYPTIQGTGLDIAVSVEQVASDDTESYRPPDVTIKSIPGVSAVIHLPANGRGTATTNRVQFDVPSGRIANLIADAGFPLIGAGSVEVEHYSVTVYDSSGTRRSASGIKEGSYSYGIEIDVHNLTGADVTATVGASSARLQDAVLANLSGGTFDIWVKNIWNSSKLSTETDSQYAERVWKPILGDREGGEAKVMFTTGALAISDDYEFTIVGFPSLDTSKVYTDAEGVDHTSYWRIKLAKSDAELEATGLYVPSAQRQGRAGDRFVFINTEMTHHYVIWNEKALDDWKESQLRDIKEIKPTWVVTTDRVRLGNGGRPNALIDRLRAGNAVVIADKRFIGGSQQETLYLQSVTYTYREPTSDDAALNPDVELVLSDRYEVTANPVAFIQGEIDAIHRQLGSIQNIEQVAKGAWDKRYMRKDMSDRTPYSLGVGGELTAGNISTNDITARNIKARGEVSARNIGAAYAELGEIVTGRVTSEEFKSGLMGYGGGLWQDDAGKWHLDVDAITARQSLTVLELLIQKIRAVGGAIVLSQASGKVAEVVETGTSAGGDSYYRLYLEDGGDGDFVAGDFVRCSHWAGDSGNPQRMHAYWEEVVKADRDPAKNGRRFIGIRRPTETGVTPSAGDELVLMGSRVEGRQGLIEITTEAGQPRITEWAGIDSPSLDAEKMMTCLGDLTGIEWQGRRLTGYGLMTRNFYGTGEIVLKSGATVEDAFAGLDERVQSMRQGSRNLVLNSGMWSPDRQITIVPGGPATGLPAHWWPLNDGCAAAVADGLLVLRKDSAVKPDGTAASRNGLHAGLSRDAIPKDTTLTVKVAGAAGNIAAGKSIQVRLYNTQPEWTHAVTLCRVTAADLAKDGSFSIEKSVTLAEDYSVPRLCVSLHDANEGAFIKLANVGLYAGDRAPELWTPAPEDIEERQQAATAAAQKAAEAAQQAADAAGASAAGASASVGELDKYVKGAFRDGIISEAEAAAIAKYTNTVNTDRERIDRAYGALYGNPYLTGAAKDGLKDAHDRVDAAIADLTTAIASATADGKVTAVESKDVDDAFAAFNTASGDFSAAVEDANKAIQATLGDASAAAKAAADNAKAAAEAAKQDAQSAKDAADKAAQDADKAVADLEDKVKTSIRDGILTAAEKASIGRYVKIVEGARDEVVATVGAILDNSHLPAAFQDSLFIAEGTTVKAAETLLGYVDNTVNGKWPESVTDEQAMGLVNDAFDAYNSAMAALRKEIEAANAAIQSAIEAEAREAADKAAQAVADGLSSRNLVPMSGLWEAVPGKDDGWGMLNGGCDASVAGHRLSMVKDTAATGEAARNGMWAQLTVPSLPGGHKVTIRVKGTIGGSFFPGGNPARRVVMTLYDSTTWKYEDSVQLLDLRQPGPFEETRTVELGKEFSVPKLCFSMMGAPVGTELTLDWVALYAGSWAPGGWTPAPEDARRMVTAREASIRHDFEVSETGLSDRIDSSVTEYRTRFGALRNLLVATRQQDGGIAGTREVFVPSRDYIDYDIPVTLGKGKTYRFDFGEWQDSHNFRGITVSVLRSDGRVLVAGDDIVFEDEAYSLFIVIPASATGTLSGCRLRIEPLDSESEGTLERLKLSEGTAYSEWTPAPEDAETYREETRTRFSVTDGLIESSVRELRQYADSAASRNLLRGYTTTDADGHTSYHTTESGEVSDYTGRSETRQLSRPLRPGGKYTFSIEDWYKAAGGSAGLSLTLRGPSGNKIVGAELPLSQQGAASVTLEVPALSEDGTFTQGDLDAARLHIFTLHHPSDITFSRFMLVAGEDTVPYAEAQEDAPMRRHETESKITQTADAINLSVEDKVSSVRSEIAVGTRMISLSVGEDAVPLGTPPFHNLLRYTNQGKRDWVAANSIHGASAFTIGETERDRKRFAVLARNDRSGTTEPVWEWMRYYGLAPRTIKSGGQYTLSFDMDARCKGAFSLGFIMQNTTETADAASTRLNPTVSKSFTPTEGDKYNDPIFGQCYRIRATVSAVLTASADGTLDAGNLRIGTSGQSLNILVLVIGDLTLTAGTEAREWTPSTADWADAMEKTGINIAERRLTLTADTVEVRNNSGVTTALLDKDGMLQTDRIRANELTVQHVTAGDPDGERVVVDPATRHIDIYDDKGEQVAIFEGNKYTAEEDLFTSNAQVTEIEADTPLLSIKCGNQSGGATYPNHDEETANAQMMRFYVATPCRAKFECSVNVTGRVNGNTAMSNYTYGKGRITLEKEGGGYGSTSTLSYAENRKVSASDLGGSLENNASAQDRTLNLTKGWYVVKAYAECLTSDYGTVTVSCYCPKVTLSYDEYVGRYFGNGFCIGKPGNFILANFTNEDGVSLRICSGGNDIRFGEGGMQVRDGDRWRSVKLELYS